jgi:Domain of unknown function DUF29
MIKKADVPQAALYESDETAWLEAMSELIEQGRVDELDYPHLAEYLADMAKRDRREVESRLTLLIEHLLKWTYQPEKQTGSWRRTIVVQRQELAEMCGKGVLRSHAEENLAKSYAKAAERAISETGLAFNTFPTESPYSLDQLLSPNVLAD